jgi:hypothetical protein
MPAYLCAMARDAGHPIDGATWSVLSPRGYRSQKVIFLLSGSADAVVKLTQDPAFNGRLDNEAAALAALDRGGIAAAAGAPQPLFAGRHAGLSVFGQSRLSGVPFHERADGDAASPWARAALERLTQLGIASAHAIDGGQLARVTAVLAERCIATYRIGGGAAAALRGAVGELRHAAPELGVVMHGDPTPLNLLVAEDGTVHMVDWENAELSAPPLWDVFYFAIAYTARWGPARGRRSPADSFASDLLQPSPHQALLASAIGAYRRRVPIPDEAVDALFLACCAYLALRQARQSTRLSLRRAPFSRMLGLALEHRAAAGSLPWTSSR